MQPLVFEVSFRPQIWGGRRLERRLGKTLPSEGRFGESWEISAHPDHLSRVAEGPLQGATLDMLAARHAPELLGRARASPYGFPWLVKFLDCHEQLSVQVHPDDETAQRLLHQPIGKTEAWVVLDVGPAGRIHAGLKPGTTQADLMRHLDAGTVAECLHSFSPRPGDCVFFPAGTVHAAGDGVVLAEVQQTSDATFRLFDWNRLDADGKPRPLHRQEALESIHWPADPVMPVKPRMLPDVPAGACGERLVTCEYFCLDRFRLAGDLPVPRPGGMSVWILIEGSAELSADDGSYRRGFRAGETVLIPACASALTWSASGNIDATLLAVTEP